MARGPKSVSAAKLRVVLKQPGGSDAITQRAAQKRRRKMKHPRREESTAKDSSCIRDTPNISLSLFYRKSKSCRYAPENSIELSRRKNDMCPKSRNRKTKTNFNYLQHEKRKNSVKYSTLPKKRHCVDEDPPTKILEEEKGHKNNSGSNANTCENLSVEQMQNHTMVSKRRTESHIRSASDVPRKSLKSSING